MEDAAVLPGLWLVCYLVHRAIIALNAQSQTHVPTIVWVLAGAGAMLKHGIGHPNPQNRPVSQSQGPLPTCS